MASGALTAAIAGLLFGLSLIVVMGAQNVFVMRQGMLRQQVSAVVVICAASDAVLIAAGVGGAGALLTGRDWLMSVVRELGAAALLAYAVIAARRAIGGPGRSEGVRASGSSRAAAIVASLAFTWLNPAVYLDTVVLLGSVANTHRGEQWWFGGGAALASILWFAALGFGAALLAPLLNRPSAPRVVDCGVALVMVATAVRLLAG